MHSSADRRNSLRSNASWADNATESPMIIPSFSGDYKSAMANSNELPEPSDCFSKDSVAQSCRGSKRTLRSAFKQPSKDSTSQNLKCSAIDAGPSSSFKEKQLQNKSTDEKDLKSVPGTKSSCRSLRSQSTPTTQIKVPQAHGPPTSTAATSSRKVSVVAISSRACRKRKTNKPNTKPSQSLTGPRRELEVGSKQGSPSNYLNRLRPRLDRKSTSGHESATLILRPNVGSPNVGMLGSADYTKAPVAAVVSIPKKTKKGKNPGKAKQPSRQALPNPTQGLEPESPEPPSNNLYGPPPVHPVIAVDEQLAHVQMEEGDGAVENQQATNHPADVEVAGSEDMDTDDTLGFPPLGVDHNDWLLFHNPALGIIAGGAWNPLHEMQDELEQDGQNGHEIVDNDVGGQEPMVIAEPLVQGPAPAAAAEPMNGQHLAQDPAPQNAAQPNNDNPAPPTPEANQIAPFAVAQPRGRRRGRRLINVPPATEVPGGEANFDGLTDALRARIFQALPLGRLIPLLLGRGQGPVLNATLRDARTYSLKCKLFLTVVRRKITAYSTNSPLLNRARVALTREGNGAKRAVLFNDDLMVVGPKAAIIHQVMALLHKNNELILDMVEGHDQGLVRAVTFGLCQRRSSTPNGLTIIRFSGALQSLYALAPLLHENRDITLEIDCTITKWPKSYAAVNEKCEEFWTAVLDSVRLQTLVIDGPRFCPPGPNCDFLVSQLQMLKKVTQLRVPCVPIPGINLATLVTGARKLKKLCANVARNNLYLGPNMVAPEVAQYRAHINPEKPPTYTEFEGALSTDMLCFVCKKSPYVRKLCALVLGREDFLSGVVKFFNWHPNRTYVYTLELACADPEDIYDHGRGFLPIWAPTITLSEGFDRVSRVWVRTLDCSRTENGRMMRLIIKLKRMTDNDRKMLTLLQP